ncbi:hypothetical protein QM012_002572 [Aureobasidium pullulans]|uniref:Uncharacterized protein n=1 Tax=Aureobasidium pullulans TaxID=5580 RepID=A0ABR0TB54_AURPU
MAPINPSQHLVGRTPAPPVPCAGCLDPAKVNNKVYFSLFALIFAAIVIASIWFFFHAKNGGFHWQEGDFEDWKSTVLRKKDANGNTIYSARSVISKPSKGDRLAAKSVVGYDEKGRKGIMAIRGFGGSHSVYYSDGFTQYSGDRSDALTSVSRNEKRAPKIRGGYTEAPTSTDHSRRYRDRDLRDYKHEKPARVGGMNRSADGTQYDYSDRSETLTEITETSSAAPILSSSDRKRQKAEKKAAEDAARMERKWRKEAERAAAALAKEQATSSVSPTSKKTSPPSKAQPLRSAKRGESGRSRSSSPKKHSTPRQRDYSFSGGPDEVSTVYTGTSTNRTNSSYYDAYRPLAQQASPERRERRASSSRRNTSASPSKQHRSSRYTYTDSEVTASTDRSGGRYERIRGGEKRSKGGRDVMAGYRRGMDSLGSDSE